MTQQLQKKEFCVTAQTTPETLSPFWDSQVDINISKLFTTSFLSYFIKNLNNCTFSIFLQKQPELKASANCLTWHSRESTGEDNTQLCPSCCDQSKHLLWKMMLTPSGN